MLKPEVCSSRDLFVLKNHIIQLFRGIFLISMPHKVNLTGINIFKRHIVDFSKISKIAIFQKCVKNLQVEKIRMFDVFPNWKGPFNDTRSSFQ